MRQLCSRLPRRNDVLRIVPDPTRQVVALLLYVGYRRRHATHSAKRTATEHAALALVGGREVVALRAASRVGRSAAKDGAAAQTGVGEELSWSETKAAPTTASILASDAEAQVAHMRATATATAEAEAAVSVELMLGHHNAARSVLSDELRMLDEETKEAREDKLQDAERLRHEAEAAAVQLLNDAELKASRALSEAEAQAAQLRQEAEGRASAAELAQGQFRATRQLLSEELRILEQEARARREEEEDARKLQAEAEADEARRRAEAAKQEAEEAKREAERAKEELAAQMAALREQANAE